MPSFCGFHFLSPTHSGRFEVVCPTLERYFASMTAAKVIEKIKQMAPKEQVEIIQFAVELARVRQLTAQELDGLADRLAEATDPAEILRLKSAMRRGFYGE